MNIVFENPNSIPNPSYWQKEAEFCDEYWPDDRCEEHRSAGTSINRYWMEMALALQPGERAYYVSGPGLLMIYRRKKNPDYFSFIWNPQD